MYGTPPHRLYVKQTYRASMPCQIFSGVREVELRPHPGQWKPDELLTGAPGDDVAVTKLVSLYATADQSDDVSDTVSPQAVPTPPSSQARRKPAPTV
eukprot:scaffold23085_cov60-Phaeocystis_antarctica.AAC.1